MTRKFKKWLKSAAGIVSIILFVISMIFLVAACSNYGNFSDRVANNINSILFGLATNLLGIIVTVSFVQHFIDRQNEKDEHEKENLKIKRYDRFINVLLTRYLMYFNCVTTSVEERSKKIHCDYHLNLSLKICVICIDNHCIHVKDILNLQ